METPPPKPWTVAQFELYRPHMSNWIIHNLCPPLEDPDCPRIVVRAPVKSGKREIVEYMAKRDESHVSPRVHLFLSAWHRAADEVQRKELADLRSRIDVGPASIAGLQSAADSARGRQAANQITITHFFAGLAAVIAIVSLLYGVTRRTPTVVVPTPTPITTTSR